MGRTGGLASRLIPMRDAGVAVAGLEGQATAESPITCDSVFVEEYTRVGIFVMISGTFTSFDLAIDWSPDGTSFGAHPAKENGNATAQIVQMTVAGTLMQWWELMGGGRDAKVRAVLSFVATDLDFGARMDLFLAKPIG